MKSFFLSLVGRTALLYILVFLFFPHSSLADESAEAHLISGLASSKKGDLEQAIASYKRAIELDPALKGAHLNLGIAYFKLQSYDLAIATFKNILERTPEDSSALLFLGLSFQGLKQYENSIPYFEKAGSLDPNFHQMALFNLGISYNKMGNREKAKSSFNKAIELDPQSEMAGNSKKFLTIMAKKPKKIKSKRWGVGASVGWEVDDNVTLVEQDIVSDVRDIAAIVKFNGEFKLIDEPKYKLEASYDFFQSKYDKVTALNFQSHTGTLYAAHKAGNLDLGANYSYTFTTLENKSFLAIQSATPSLGIFHNKNLYTYLSYTFTDKNFNTDDPRDANVHSLGIDQFIFFMKFKGYLLAGYRVNHENAFGGEFDYLGHTAKVGLKVPIVDDNIVKISYNYNFKDYENVTPSIAVEREDEKHTATMELSKKIYDNLEVKLGYEYVNSISNLGSTEYTENVGSIQLEFSNIDTTLPKYLRTFLRK